jgi:hypothetical protein
MDRGTLTPRSLSLPDIGTAPPSARLGLLGVGGLLITSLLVCLSAGQSELLEPTSLRPLPHWLAGPFDGAGFELGLGAVIAAFLLMFLSYAAAARAAEKLSARTVLISIAALNAIALFAPPLFSSDIFSYDAYGRMGVVYGSNPYLHGPSAIPLEALHGLIGAQWIGTPTAYGPLFTALSYLLVPFDIAATVFAYKAVAALSCVLLIAMVWRAAGLRGLDPVKAVAFVGLNPVIFVYGVGGGHNDLMMLAILVTGLYVLLQRRERSSGVLIVVATAVKLTAGLLLPFALAAPGRNGDGTPRAGAGGRRRLLLGVAIGVAAIAALAFTLFGAAPLQLPGTLQGIQSQGGMHSVVGFVLTAVGLGALAQTAATVLTVAFIITVAWLLRRVWTGQLDWITGAGWATVALLIATGFLVPWYVAWLLPLAALSSDRRLGLTAIAMTGLALTTL